MTPMRVLYLANRYISLVLMAGSVALMLSTVSKGAPSPRCTQYLMLIRCRRVDRDVLETLLGPNARLDLYRFVRSSTGLSWVLALTSTHSPS